MAAKLARLTHKIATQLHLVAERLSFAVLAQGGQSGNFWIHPRTYVRMYVCMYVCMYHVRTLLPLAL
jgi:hypothetical protein